MSKSLLAVCSLLMFLPLCAAQDNEKQPLACRVLYPEVFPQETCSAILTYLSPQDELGLVSEDGSFIVLSPRPDGKMNLNTYYLPPKLRSEIALRTMKQTLDAAAMLATARADRIADN